MKIFSRLLDLLFPPRCIVCRRFLSKGYICPECEGNRDTDSCRRFNLAMGKNSRLMEVYAAHDYIGEYRRNIHKFKFGGVTHYAEAIARLTVDRLPKATFAGADLIAFVPVSRDVQGQRGYDQAELLARSLSKLTGIPVKPIIDKIKRNKPQHTLSAKERRKNVKGVFAVEADLKGQNIILVDDIITTGETMSECAKLLFKAGAEKVTGICAANANT